MSNLIKYGGFDEESAAADEKELSKGSSNFAELGQGLNQVRFIPALVGRKTFVVTQNHFVEIPGTEDKISFNCPRLMAPSGGSRPFCPACTAGEKLGASNNSVDRKRAQKFWARKRIYGNILHRAQPEEGVQTLAFGKKIHERLIFFRRSDGVDFTDPVAGFDIKIVRKGTGINTKYPNIDMARKPSRLAATDQAINDLIESAPDLSRYAAIPGREEMDEQMEKAGGEMEDLADDGGGGSSPRGGRNAMDDAEADDAMDAEFSED